MGSQVQMQCHSPEPIDCTDLRLGLDHIFPNAVYSGSKFLNRLLDRVAPRCGETSRLRGETVSLNLRCRHQSDQVLWYDSVKSRCQTGQMELAAICARTLLARQRWS